MSPFDQQSLFQSQADIGANSFTNPYPNYANMGQGWNIDPSLLTPSFTAPYRPQYFGSSPAYQYELKPSFSQGVMNAFFPQNPYWGNPVFHQDPSVDSVASKPFDAMAWGVQRIALPALGYGLAAKALGPRSNTFWGTVRGTLTGQGLAGDVGRSIGGGFGRGLGQSFFGARNVNAASAAYSAARAGGVGTALNSAFGAGGFRGLAGMAMAGGMGTAGAIASSVALPMAVGYAATVGLDKLIVQPYADTSRNANDLLRNFSGVSFHDAQGHAVTGGGLGRQEANFIGGQIARDATSDFTFSNSEYSNIADLASRAGLLDGTSSRNISKQIKSIAEQIKLIVAISKDPDIQNAIEALSELSHAGASTKGGRYSNAAQVYSALGSYASQAGVTVQQIMEQSGKQGQYLYSMNGMTPYVGQLAAANTYANFAAAYRTGMLGKEQFARMGGIEGATQAAVSGSLTAAQTPYNMMATYNQYMMGQSRSSNVIENIARFGQNVAQDPITAQGNLILYGKAATSRWLKDTGNRGAEQQAIEYMDNMRGVFNRDSNGKYSTSQLAMAYRGLGLTDEQIQGLISERAAESDPRTIAQRMAGETRHNREQLRQFIDQNGLYAGVIGRTVHSVRSAGRDLTNAFGDGVGRPVAEAKGWFADRLAEGFDYLAFGDTVKKTTSGSVKDLLLDKKFSGGLEELGFTETSRDENGVAQFTSPYKVFDLNKMHLGLLIKGARETSDWSFGPFGDTRWVRKGDRTSVGDIKMLATQLNTLNPRVAAEYFNEKDPNKQKNILAKLIRENKEHFTGTYDMFVGSSRRDGKNLDEAASFMTSYLGKPQVLTKDMMVGTSLENDLQSAAGENNLGVYDDARLIGMSTAILTDMRKHDVSPGEIDDFIELNKEKYGEFKSLSGGRTGKALYNFAGDRLRYASKTGLLGLGNTAFKAGSLEQFKNNPSLITDPDLRAKFEAALASNNTAEMEKIALAHVNGTLKARDDTAVNVDKGPLDKAIDLARTTVEARERMEKIVNSGEGQINYKGFVESIGTFENVARSFETSVKLFADIMEYKDPNKPGWFGKTVNAIASVFAPDTSTEGKIQTADPFTMVAP